MTRGLLVDFGGVLTASVGSSFRRFERQHDLPKGTVLRLLQQAYHDDAGHEDPIARFERGEVELADFEVDLAARFLDAGYAVAADGIVDRLFGGQVPDEAMWGVVGRARAGGVRTGLLSNSWGVDAYPRERFAEAFDTVVISGEVGMRKPSPGIFVLAAERLGLTPRDCAFVDDLERNVEVAREVGMFGVLHRDAAGTVAALEPFLGVPVADGSEQP